MFVGMDVYENIFSVFTSCRDANSIISEEIEFMRSFFVGVKLMFQCTKCKQELSKNGAIYTCERRYCLDCQENVAPTHKCDMKCCKKIFIMGESIEIYHALRYLEVSRNHKYLYNNLLTDVINNKTPFFDWENIKTFCVEECSERNCYCEICTKFLIEMDESFKEIVPRFQDHRRGKCIKFTWNKLEDFRGFSDDEYLKSMEQVNILKGILMMEEASNSETREMIPDANATKKFYRTICNDCDMVSRKVKKQVLNDKIAGLDKILEGESNSKSFTCVNEIMEKMQIIQKRGIDVSCQTLPNLHLTLSEFPALVDSYKALMRARENENVGDSGFPGKRPILYCEWDDDGSNWKFLGLKMEKIEGVDDVYDFKTNSVSPAVGERNDCNMAEDSCFFSTQAMNEFFRSVDQEEEEALLGSWRKCAKVDQGPLKVNHTTQSVSDVNMAADEAALTICIPCTDANFKTPSPMVRDAAGRFTVVSDMTTSEKKRLDVFDQTDVLMEETDALMECFLSPVRKHSESVENASSDVSWAKLMSDGEEECSVTLQGKEEEEDDDVIASTPTRNKNKNHQTLSFIEDKIERNRRRVETRTNATMISVSLRRDAVVTAVQDSNILNLENMRPGKGQLTTSRLTQEEIYQCSRFCEKFSILYSSVFEPEETAYLVVQTDEGNKTLRTFKYLQGIIYAARIVSMQWIYECLKQGKLLPEDDFIPLDESGESGPLTAFKVSKKLQSSPLAWLQDYCFYFLGKIPPEFDQAKTKAMLEKAGALVVNKIGDLHLHPNRHHLIIYFSDITPEYDVFDAFVSAFKAATIHFEWIMQVIGRNRWIPFGEYLLTSGEMKDILESYCTFPSHVLMKEPLD